IGPTLSRRRTNKSTSTGTGTSPENSTDCGPGTGAVTVLVGYAPGSSPSGATSSTDVAVRGNCNCAVYEPFVRKTNTDRFITAVVPSRRATVRCARRNTGPTRFSSPD